MSDDECEYSVQHEESGEGEDSVQHEEPDEGEDSVGEDAELELSCALQDLAQRVKTFEENMKGRFRDAGEGDEIDDEIDEDIPEADAPVPEAAPKQHRRRKEHKKLGSKAASKQQEDEDNEDDDSYGDDEFSDDGSDEYGGEGAKGGRDDDWDYQEQTEELSELKHNIALLLQGFKEEAKALERGGEDNQAK